MNTHEFHYYRNNVSVMLNFFTFISFAYVFQLPFFCSGLCAFSASMDNPYLAFPASSTEGSILVYNVMDLQSHCEVVAHILSSVADFLIAPYRPAVCQFNVSFITNLYYFG